MSIRILLADDHELFLNGMRALLEKQPGIEVVAEAKNGHEAVQASLEQEPDVVVMDLTMPGMNGIEATRQITQALPTTKVLCLSMHAERRFVLAALDVGAAGYLLKDCPLDSFVKAIHAVEAGQTFLCPVIAGIVVDACKAGEPIADLSAFSLLTSREIEVLQLTAEGYSTNAISERLCVSRKTVNTHAEHVMDKLQIHSVAGLTKYAIREGLTESEDVVTCDWVGRVGI